MIHILNYIKKNKLLWPILLAGFVLYMVPIFANGIHGCYAGKCGLYFTGVFSYDMIWHMALSGSAFSSWPFTVPIFSGVALQSYNYLMDFIVSLLSKVGFSNMFLYFKVLPVLWYIFFTISLIRFGLLLNKSPKFIALLLFLSYFTGTFGYLLTFLHHGTLSGSSSLFAMQGLQSLVNMQYAFSLIFLLEVLILIKKGKIGLQEGLLFALYIFINFGLKFYGGIITSFLVALYLFIKVFPLNKKSTDVFWMLLLVFLSTVISIFVFYNPIASASTGAIFQFKPLETVHPVIESTELLYLPKIASYRNALRPGDLRLIPIEIFTLAVFLFFNFGVRVIGFGYQLKKIISRKCEVWELLAFVTGIFAILLNILFVQKGEWWNTVQFLYYGIFIMTIFTAQALFQLIQIKKTIPLLIMLLIIAITLPMDIDVIAQFQGPRAQTYIPDKEVVALQFLKKLPKGVVYVPLYDDKLLINYSAPLPMYLNYDTPYVSAFSQKQVLLSTTSQIQLIGIDYSSRLEKIQKNDCSLTRDIDYAYIVKDYFLDKYVLKCIDGQKKYLKVFDNGEVWIYKKVIPNP